MPHLIVKGADKAIAFYEKAFGAKEIMRFADDELGHFIAHAELALGDAVLSLSDESPGWGNIGPRALGGSPVVLTLECASVDDVATRAVAEGARLVFPVADQFYGYRQGRIEDPFGHLWILSTRQESLSVDEMRARLARTRSESRSSAK
jgi:PhnB protein